MSWAKSASESLRISSLLVLVGAAGAPLGVERNRDPGGEPGVVEADGRGLGGQQHEGLPSAPRRWRRDAAAHGEHAVHAVRHHEGHREAVATARLGAVAQRCRTACCSLASSPETASPGPGGRHAARRRRRACVGGREARGRAQDRLSRRRPRKERRRSRAPARLRPRCVVSARADGGGAQGAPSGRRWRCGSPCCPALHDAPSGPP